ncbi:Protein N-acetyltransferase, RimJ/RimL family [Thalassospira xiamenensis M-5 = DSM 17429]|uniref:N-acetyltransferase GCN5 n=1 Tax=Thalassospira xiamenensis M-5 = DSM 17429 TaxID=1123366 RepID=A0AB72UFP4_9PROT|nr:GNAT family N-acetyltransferase [Thalassospira xiamenensis]AJD53043.1 N-acetyltransferase GCN5 [Thalassospira xiamenensis M-5 = DSM 17429]SIT29066.1 Protein N-acetyltransferase, RimJ/RimL family [Thalassospira xiamenensis M-5 = DSM 17429]
MSSLTNFSAQTERLYLRCVEDQDAETIASLMVHEIACWLASWKVPFTVEMARDRITRSRKEAAAGDALPLAIIERETDRFVGWVSLYRYQDNPRRGMLGYWIGIPAQRRGYLSEIKLTILQAGFDLFGFDSIEAGAQLANEASFGVMTSWGMKSFEERMAYSSARDRQERCRYYQITREEFRFSQENA